MSVVSSTREVAGMVPTFLQHVLAVDKFVGPGISRTHREQSVHAAEHPRVSKHRRSFLVPSTAGMEDRCGDRVAAVEGREALAVIIRIPGQIALAVDIQIPGRARCRYPATWPGSRCRMTPAPSGLASQFRGTCRLSGRRFAVPEGRWFSRRQMPAFGCVHGSGTWTGRTGDW